MSPLDTPAALALIAVSVVTFAVLIIAGLARAAGRPAAHPPTRATSRVTRCAVLACDEPADLENGWVFDRFMCTRDAARINNRSAS